MANQLYIKEHLDKKNIFPKNYTDNIRDKESNKTLTEILQGFNCYFLSYTGSIETTRLQVPKLLRKQGLWITYVDYENNTITEYYDNPSIEDSAFKDSSNWREGNNRLVGDLSISANGNWVINGVETEFKAQGEAGTTPLIRLGDNNKFQVSYNKGNKWEDISGYIEPTIRMAGASGNSIGHLELSMDKGTTWKSLSGDIVNNLKISKYIGIYDTLPTSGVKEGTIYMKGPYYDENDTNNDNPIYRMWVYAWKGDTLAWVDNGEFTSIIAGVVQETGDSEDKVMSQKAVSEILGELGSEVGLVNLNTIGIQWDVPLTKNKEHVSSIDRVSVNIKGGETVFIITRNNENLKGYAIINIEYIDGERENVGNVLISNGELSFVASKDIAYIGMYVPAENILETTELVLYVYKSSTIMFKLMSERVLNTNKIYKLQTSDLKKGTIYKGEETTALSSMFVRYFFAPASNKITFRFDDRTDGNSWYTRVIEYDRNFKYLGNIPYSKIEEYTLSSVEAKVIRIAFELTNSNGESVNFDSVYDALSLGSIEIGLDEYYIRDEQIIKSGITKDIVPIIGEITLSNIASTNIFDNSKATDVALNANGKEYKTDIHTSDYIYCHGNEYVSTNYGGRDNVCHCFYDNVRNFISSVPSSQKGGYKIPDGAYFVRLCMSAYSNANYAAFVNKTDLSDDDYVPYQTINERVIENSNKIADNSNRISVVEEKQKVNSYGFVRCNTASDVAIKSISIPDMNEGEIVRFTVQMNNETSVQSSLSINGNTAHDIIYNGVYANKNNTWKAGENLDVTFNRNYPAYIATTRTKLSQNEGDGTDVVMSQKAVTELVKNLRNELKDNAGISAKSLNRDKQSAITSMVCQKPKIYGVSYQKCCVALAVMTDVHSDLERYKRVCEYVDDTEEIEGTLSLGDIIETTAHANPYPLILQYAKPVLSIVGNHEVIKGSYFEGWDENDLIENMFNAEQIAHNGDIHPSGKCYWHRDFTKELDGVTRTLRVIGLHSYESNGVGLQNTGSGKDVTYYSQEQINWLVERLEEVDANTKVMILIHFAPTNDLQKVECPFTPSDYIGIVPEGGSRTGGKNSMSDDLFLPKIIQAWIKGESVNASCQITLGENVSTISVNKTFSAHPKQFVGWLAGHTHEDYISKIATYPEQNVIVFTCTTNSAPRQSSDLGRSEDGKSQDAFTIISVDWFKDRVNLVRIGADVTCDMRERKYYNFEL